MNECRNCGAPLRKPACDYCLTVNEVKAVETPGAWREVKDVTSGFYYGYSVVRPEHALIVLG